MSDAAIVCESLTKSYGQPPRGVRALDGVDLIMPAGSIFGFLGPNGAGKTTTIKVLLGLAHATSGRCSIYGVPVESFSAQSRREVGYLAQDPAYPRWMTGREVLRFVGRLYPLATRPVEERVAEALTLVDLEGAADRACGGYSAGMRQRLGIAQSLMGDPRLVILDEPSSSLDPIGRRDVLNILRLLRDRGIAVFYSTHILDDVERVADHVAIMKQGKVVRTGAMRDLMSASQDRFRLTVEAPAGGLPTLLRDLPWVTAIEPAEIHDGRESYLIDVRDGNAAKRDLPRAVIEADYVLIGCEPARSRLEDIFIESVTDSATDRDAREQAGRPRATAGSSADAG
jgi:ABC-2 type transport system ATP-binding protein